MNGSGAFGSPSQPASAPIDWSSFDGVTAALTSGAFNGPIQLIAAALIFLAAGRCIARMFGLGLVLFGFVAWQQGMRGDDVAPLLQSLWLRLSAAFAAFMAPPAA